MKDGNWRQIESILMAFEAAWQTETPPDIDDFLEGGVLERQRSLLAELVMIDFEHRWRRDAENVDDYFVRFPELLNDRELRDEVLSQEFRLRTSIGKSPSEAELERRFAGDSKVVELCRQIDAHPIVPISSLLTPGAMIGPYRINKCIGQGAFATVFSAVDTELQRDVALKFLNSSDVRSASRMRLRREAQAVATLTHPNIVPVFGAGNFRGHDYVVSRLVAGITLDQWLKGYSPEVATSVEIAIQLASALSEAHRAGIVHRDIKPANVMIEDDVPRLLDFGLAHLIDTSQDLTHEGDVVGTPAFMPPEQADGRGWQADPRSDLYSLGSMLYLMVFRRLPFEGTTSEVISQILRRDASVPHDSPVSRDLQTIILKCLEKDPSLRYQSADELRHDLQSFMDGKPIIARPIGVAGRLMKWTRRHPAMAILLVGVVMLTAFGGGAATQLRSVTMQRDRAQQAEQETQALLAASAADAGRLAMQRGKFDAAINHFEQALDRGYADQTELLISLVEANFVLRKIGQSAKLLARAAESPFDQKHLPALALWRAEIAWEGQAELGDGEQLFERASEMQLSPVDARYVQGVLAEHSLDAVEKFRGATELDPYHYRSHRMLIFMLLSLARTDECELQLRIARQLFPGDQDFLLLDALVSALRGELETAERLVQESSLDDETQVSWQRFCRRLDEIANGNLFEPDNDNQAIVWLQALSRQFQTEFVPLLSQRNWRFPPRISRKFSEFEARLPTLFSEPGATNTEALEALVAIHPEATLFQMLGALQLVGVSADAADPDQAILLLKKSRDNFRQSIDHLGFVKQSGQRAWVSIFTTSMTLALVHRHDVENNQQQYTEASRLVSYQTVKSTNQARAFTIAALNANEMDEADRWMIRWKQLPNHDDQSQADMHWHQAIIYKRHEDWLGVVSSCDRVLEFAPDHQFAPGLQDQAVKEIDAALKASASERANAR